MLAGSLVCVPVDVTISAVGIKICAITAGIKRYKSIIKIKKKKHNNVVLLAKDTLNTIEILICKAFIDPYISPDEFVSLNLLREYYKMKEEIKNPETSEICYIKTRETYSVKKTLQTKIQVSEKLNKIE